MLKEFKEFAVRGNVLDMAIGIILGVAFGKIVTSFVEDVLMPPLGLVIGKVDFANLFLQPDGQALRQRRRGQGGGSAHAQLRHLHQQCAELHHRSVRDFPAGAAGEPYEAAAGARASEHARVSLLLRRDPAESHSLQLLHFGSAEARERVEKGSAHCRRCSRGAVALRGIPDDQSHDASRQDDLEVVAMLHE